MGDIHLGKGTSLKLVNNNTFLWENPNFEYFLKINRTFNLSDLWGLPSWYLGLSVEKIQIPSYKFTRLCDVPLLK